MIRKNFIEVDVFGIPIAKLTMLETLLVVEEAIEKEEQLHHVVVNAGKIVAMQNNPFLKKFVLGADLINVDGMAVLWAANLVGKNLPERVAGIDLMENLVELAYENNYKCFFLGAKEEVVTDVVRHYSEMYNPNVVAGYHNGYFKRGDDVKIAQMIVDSGAQILFVAMESPLKEIFLESNKYLLGKVNMIMEVDSGFDVVAGKLIRNPVWIQATGLEWIFRFIQEPKRMLKKFFPFMFIVSCLSLKSILVFHC